MQQPQAKRLAFPPGFRWSAATSAHQVEGGNDNSDWWDFEGRPGAIKRGERSGRAADHWNRVAEDIELAKQLNLNHLRISVEWARIETSPGIFDQAALAHYDQELSALRDAGIEPLVTLHHFTLPKWVAAKGGWSNPEISAAFARYSEVVYARLGDKVRDWITINEPMVLVVAGYLSGDFPPALRDPAGIFPPLQGLVRGHAAAYHALHAMAKAARQPLRVGLAHHLRVFDPARSWHPVDRLAAWTMGNAFNWTIPDALLTGKLQLHLPFVMRHVDHVPEAKGTEDFVGLNYYSRDLIRFAPRRQFGFVRHDAPDTWRSDLGWEIYPQGIYRVLKDIKSRYPNAPVMITENGLADAADKSRARFIQEHLRFIHQAIAEGIEVEAYSHWSLMDNFEWAEGFAPRFGLHEVDFASMARSARGSAEVYAQIAKTNGIYCELS